MAGVDTVLLKVASRCNIACDYCYVYSLGDTGWTTMPKAMTLETIDAVVAALGKLYIDQSSGFAIVLHGGEPLLLGHNRLAALLTGLRQQLPESCSISIQTNGTLISNDVLDLCSSTRTNMSVSLDGPKTANDLHRVGFSQESTFQETLDGIRTLQSHWDADFLFTGVLCVIDPTTDPADIYAFFKRIGVPSLNFLLRDGNHTRLPAGKASFESTEYGVWLTSLWRVYTSDPDPIPIRTFDDIAKLIMGGRAAKEGVGTTDYSIVIIDTDGSICKNDTLKSTYDRADRFEEDWSVLKDGLYDITNTSPFQAYLRSQNPTSSLCLHCPVLDVCGGGMPLYRWKDGYGYDNPSVYCTDHKLLIDRIGQDILESLQCDTL